MNNMQIWNNLKQPPKNALKTIGAGRLKGKTDINPQWRYQAMTEQFGPCGMGWKYEIKRLWIEPTIDSQVMAFAEVAVYIKDGDKWSDSIPGIGGSMMVAKEKSGPYASDECFKMAVTDALSVALKMLGVAADIYGGLWDGSKYLTSEPQQPTQKLQLTPGTDEWKRAVKRYRETGSLELVEQHRIISIEDRKQLIAEATSQEVV
jgi:hypothetical protein